LLFELTPDSVCCRNLASACPFFLICILHSELFAKKDSGFHLTLLDQSGFFTMENPLKMCLPRPWQKFVFCVRGIL